MAAAIEARLTADEYDHLDEITLTALDDVPPPIADEARDALAAMPVADQG